MKNASCLISIRNVALLWPKSPPQDPPDKDTLALAAFEKMAAAIEAHRHHRAGNRIHRLDYVTGADPGMRLSLPLQAGLPGVEGDRLRYCKH